MEIKDIFSIIILKNWENIWHIESLLNVGLGLTTLEDIL